MMICILQLAVFPRQFSVLSNIGGIMAATNQTINSILSSYILLLQVLS